MKLKLLVLFVMAGLMRANLFAQQSDQMELSNNQLRLNWTKDAEGWRLSAASAKSEKEWVSLPSPSGRYTIIYLNRNPSAHLTEVDREGLAYPFFPSEAEKRSDGKIVFKKMLPFGELTAEWWLDEKYPTDVRVLLSLKTSQKGSVSIASPTLGVFKEEQIFWGMVPGHWYGNSVQPNFELSPTYSQGLPNRAFLAHEKNAMTLCPLITSKDGLTLGVIPDPEYANDPWESSVSTRDIWKIGLSTIDRYGQLTPVIYHPVLGQSGSLNEAGATIKLAYRYSLQAAPWFSVFKHAAMDIYQFPQLLDLQTSKISLSDRVNKLAKMLTDDKKSSWKVVKYNGIELGANGTKTSDVGAMYMLAGVTGFEKLKERLAYIRNYKLAQQQMSPGFFQHAATGEYPGETGFMAERGNWIEPLFTTYYTMLDIGNMSLFKPEDAELKQRLRLAADKLLAWQHADGSFDVAYDTISHLSSFPQLTDVRPTWYGLAVAARVLGDKKYLDAARKGADWYLENAVAKGHYLGACGDALNIWDFTTVFGAQALLDIYDLTKDEKYKAAAIEVARVYATSIFTHPIPSTATKTVAGKSLADWEFTQTGLSVEHIRGTATSGPVLLSSHCGLFVRIYELTRDQIFLDMARAAARGRQHFTDTETGMSVYYWNAVDKVEKVTKLFPWHAEWQVGWITDYLISEAHLRSESNITFPHGFPTPKVGSHVSYGFAPGKIYGQEAWLWYGKALVQSDNPNSEYLSAISSDRKTLFLIVLNQYPKEQTISLKIDRDQTIDSQSFRLGEAKSIAGVLESSNVDAGTVSVKLPAWGFAVVSVPLGQ